MGIVIGSPSTQGALLYEVIQLDEFATCLTLMETGGCHHGRSKAQQS
ncbi:hypothetical protein MES4922_360002 [Mesorhizobium ventifaucium]|uniref:Uncharacterized protein n=1 Tax=Mesorhizobium ventifaucium TaxID=666020 RepID=A0ABN8K423_9HYPH|nr:hypothetical protein MES4922_360002 [Mesorhizobium ventifaucium]